MGAIASVIAPIFIISENKYRFGDIGVSIRCIIIIRHVAGITRKIMPINADFDPNEVFMGTNELMARAGWDRNDVRSAITSRKVTPVIVAGRPLYYRTEIEAYLAKREAAGLPVYPYQRSELV